MLYCKLINVIKNVIQNKKVHKHVLFAENMSLKLHPPYTD